MGTVEKNLRKARALVTAGWTQGAWERRGRVCAAESLSIIDANYGDNRLCLDWALPDESTSIVKFNDTKGRKKSEVLEVFDVAIENAKGAGI
jgi:hypothetical protein